MTTEEQKIIDHFGTKQVHIDTIRVGDTVMHDNAMRTVSPAFISYGGFMGTSLWGDSYRSGSRSVTKVLLN
ncbi:MAG: hypothetical protein P8J32_04560 [bacterium]|nr:hypothetical protein [bacterium]